MARVIDLSHPLTVDMPLFPGTVAPTFDTVNTLEAQGYRERRLSFASHTGTHLDAPAHLIAKGATLSELEADHFVGAACLLDARGKTSIDEAFVEAHEHQLAQSDFAILRTGWEEKWGTREYLQGFATLTPAAAKRLTRYDLLGIGLDAISADPMDAAVYEVHLALLGANLIIVENLRNLGMLPEQDFTFCALPLPIAGGDGSPVRAVAFVD